MMSHRGFGVVFSAAALAALGAAPPGSWDPTGVSLPPVSVSPGVPVRPSAPNAMPLPARITPALPSGPVPGTMPGRPALSAPAVPVATVPAAIPSSNARVYIINGVDPFGWGGLSQMADRIRDSGYPDTKFGSWYQVLKFDREIRAAHRQDPSTPVVIIGYSFGVYRARALANRLARDGIPVSMVGYIGGDYLRNTPGNAPAGAHVVNVTGDGYLLTGKNMFFNGTELNGADNVRMPGVRHFSLPKQEQTLNALVNGIHSASGRGGWAMPPSVASGPGGTPGSIMAGPELVREPRGLSASSPISATGRR